MASNRGQASLVPKPLSSPVTLFSVVVEGSLRKLFSGSLDFKLAKENGGLPEH
jgi:hypothetical protein